MPTVELTTEEGWKLRALAERRARAEIAMQASQAQHRQAQADYNRAGQEIDAALLAVSARTGGPDSVEKITVSIPPDDRVPGSIEWPDDGGA